MSGIKGMKWGFNKENLRKKRIPGMITSLHYTRKLARAKYQHLHKIELPRDILVHHIDGNPFNNKIENLITMEIAAHTKHHFPKKVKVKKVKKVRKWRLYKRLNAYLWAIGEQPITLNP